MTDDKLMADLVAEMPAGPVVQPPDKLDRLRALADEVRRIDEWVERAEALVAERKARAYAIVSREMIDVMDQRPVVDAIEVDGVAYRVVEEFHAAIRKDSSNRDAAHDFLEQHQAGALIRYAVVATFSRDAKQQVARFAKYVSRYYPMAAIEVTRDVPWARLTSWFKERILRQREAPSTDDLALPYDLLGASIERRVEFSRPNRKKRR